jgi:tetratricopeptide (TPR) repeat protein
MSYINEALKKAQKQREITHEGYGGVVSHSATKGGFFSRHPVLWISLFCLLILLAFGFYSWLDFKAPPKTSTARMEVKKPVIVEQSQSEDDTKTKYEKARFLHKSGKLGEAKRLYGETLRSDPGYVDALNNLGVIFMYEKNYEAARSSFEKAIRLEPKNVDPYYNLACVCAIADDIKKSLVYLRKAVSLNKVVIDWARKDSDLQRLQGLSEFEKIIGNAE